MWLDTPAKPGAGTAAAAPSRVVVSRNRAALCGAAWNPSRSPRARETAQIVVVGNGSSDGSAELDADFPAGAAHPAAQELRTHQGHEHRVARGRRGLRSIPPRRCRGGPGAVLRLAESWMPAPNAGAACPLLVDDEGRPAPQLGTSHPTAVARGRSLGQRTGAGRLPADARPS